MRSSLNHWFPKEQGAAEITEIVLDWSRSIRRRSDAVLPGQINRDDDLRPEAMDAEHFLADRQNQAQVVANQDNNHSNRLIQRLSATL